MLYLFIFVSGILFDSIVLPLINCALEHIETNKEVFVSNKSVVVSKNNIEIQKMQLENNESPVSAIGFECPSDCEDEYDDDLEDCKRKVGF